MTVNERRMIIDSHWSYGGLPHGGHMSLDGCIFAGKCLAMALQHNHASLGDIPCVQGKLALKKARLSSRWLSKPCACMQVTYCTGNLLATCCAIMALC